MTRTKRGRSISLLLLRDCEIGAAEFKSRCLEIMDEVHKLGVSVTITKHRRPVAKLIPAQALEARFCGLLKGLVLKQGDIVSPIDVDWDANASNSP